MLEPVKCQVCGKVFVPRNSLNKNCSQECSAIAKVKRSKERNRKIRNTNVNKTCIECGKPIPLSVHLNSSMCSKECKAKRRRRKNRMSALKKTLEHLGLEFDESNMIEVAKANGVHIPQEAKVNYAKPVTQTAKDIYEAEAFMKEREAHIKFRESIKPETIASDEAEARRLGVSYGIYVAFYKGRESNDSGRVSQCAKN